MHLCYIDESGDSQIIKTRTDQIQPVLVIAGLFVESSQIRALTQEFINVKRQFYPGTFRNVNHDLDILLTEIKGSDIRTDLRKHGQKHQKVKVHFRFLDEVFALCSKYNIKLVGRIWAKEFGVPIVDQSVYSISAQNITTRFQCFLAEQNSSGMVIADFRDPGRNRYVAHSIFTKKYKRGGDGDEYPLIQETATFGISHNHCCLQIADLLCSAIISPMAGFKICGGAVSNAHTHPNYEVVGQRYGKRLKALQYHCKPKGNQLWGLSLHNPHSNRKTIVDFFR